MSLEIVLVELFLYAIYFAFHSFSKKYTIIVSHEGKWAPSKFATEKSVRLVLKEIESSCNNKKFGAANMC